LPEEISATISSFKVRTEKSSDETLSVIEEYKRYDKPKALEMLGRHFGLFTDKIEHSGDVGGVLVVPSTVSQDEWVKLAKAQQKEIKEK
jgi:phage terminase small subunit